MHALVSRLLGGTWTIRSHGTRWMNGSVAAATARTRNEGNGRPIHQPLLPGSNPAWRWRWLASMTAYGASRPLARTPGAGLLTEPTPTVRPGRGNDLHAPRDYRSRQPARDASRRGPREAAAADRLAASPPRRMPEPNTGDQNSH